jgi:hypothetical protein
MRRSTIASLLGLGIFISGCTNTDDPQLAMCQAVARQLTGDAIASWDKTSQNDTSRLRTVAIAYSGADSSKGAIDCTFPVNSEGVVDTAPNAVVFNGQNMGTRELLSVGLKASAEMLKGTAANTVAKSKELAGEAGAIASDVAGKARDAAVDATKSLQQKLDN